MNINAEATVAISFVAFLFVFVKKVYPFILSHLDSRVNDIKSKIDEAERKKQQSSEDLRLAYVHREEIKGILEKQQAESAQKIQRLYDDNERLLQELRLKQEQALNARLKAEFIKQKEDLTKKIADTICDKVRDRLTSEKAKLSSTFTKEELSKLL